MAFKHTLIYRDLSVAFEKRKTMQETQGNRSAEIYIYKTREQETLFSHWAHIPLVLLQLLLLKQFMYVYYEAYEIL